MVNQKIKNSYNPGIFETLTAGLELDETNADKIDKLTADLTNRVRIGDLTPPQAAAQVLTAYPDIAYSEPVTSFLFQAEAQRSNDFFVSSLEWISDLKKFDMLCKKHQAQIKNDIDRCDHDFGRLRKVLNIEGARGKREVSACILVIGAKNNYWKLSDLTQKEMACLQLLKSKKDTVS